MVSSYVIVLQLPADLWRLTKLKSLTFFNTPAYTRLVKDIQGGVTTPNLHDYHHPASQSAQMLNTKTVLEHLKSLPRR